MKTVAILLILFGSGLAAFGLSGFSGVLYPDQQLTDPVRTQSPVSGSLDGSFGWDLNERLEITVGAILLIGGLMIRDHSK